MIFSQYISNESKMLSLPITLLRKIDISLPKDNRTKI